MHTLWLFSCHRFLPHVVNDPLIYESATDNIGLLRVTSLSVRYLFKNISDYYLSQGHKYIWSNMCQIYHGFCFVCLLLVYFHFDSFILSHFFVVLNVFQQDRVMGRETRARVFSFINVTYTQTPTSHKIKLLAYSTSVARSALRNVNKVSQTRGIDLFL